MADEYVKGSNMRHEQGVDMVPNESPLHDPNHPLHNPNHPLHNPNHPMHQMKEGSAGEEAGETPKEEMHEKEMGTEKPSRSEKATKWADRMKRLG